jgi:uncharacterized membrane protein YhaH (DUF805 family)
LLDLLTRFQGRISRASWWLGFAIVLGATILGSLILDPGVWLAKPPRPPSPLLAAWELVLVLPMTAIAVKRFNDRDRPPWFGIAMGAVGAALILAEQRGFMVDPSAATPLEHLVFWLVVAVFLLALADNGFMRGTRGANRYGPDPLASDCGDGRTG